MQVLKAEVVVGMPGVLGDRTSIPIRLSNGDLEEAVYTAPFNRSTPGKGGFTAYPAAGDMILVTTCDDDTDLTYYYLSTIVAAIPDDDRAIPNYPKGSNNLGTGNSLRKSVGVKDDFESGLEMYYETTTKSDEIPESMENARNSKVRLYAGAAHLEFERNLEKEHVQLKTRSGESKLTLIGSDNEFNPDSMEARTHGNLQVISMAGSINLTCHSDGGEIRLTNYARPTLPLPNSTKGDVWIESWANQVNLNAYAFHPEATPAVFITSNRAHQGSVVGVRSGGDVEIVANYGGVASIPPSAGVPRDGKITLWADSDINIVSANGDINLKAMTGKVNLQPTSPPVFVPTPDHKGM